MIERVGPCRLAPRTEGTHFDHVARAIVYQQLSGKAAATIYRRLCETQGGRAPNESELLGTSDEALRAVGLSRQKISYLRDLASRVGSGDLAMESLDALEDDAIVERLVSVRGVGRWTAQMFLMFRLGRPDVLPEADLGIQNAVKRAYGLRTRPTPKQVLRRGELWRPHRTVASWYLWRSLDATGGGEP